MCLICLRKQTRKLFHARSTRKYFQFKFTDSKKAQLKSNQIELNRTELNRTENSLRTFFSLNLNIFGAFHNFISSTRNIFAVCLLSIRLGSHTTRSGWSGSGPGHMSILATLIEWMHWPLHDFSPKIYCLLLFSSSVFSLSILGHGPLLT